MSSVRFYIMNSRPTELGGEVWKSRLKHGPEQMGRDLPALKFRGVGVGSLTAHASSFSSSFFCVRERFLSIVTVGFYWGPKHVISLLWLKLCVCWGPGPHCLFKNSPQIMWSGWGIPEEPPSLPGSSCILYSQDAYKATQFSSPETATLVIFHFSCFECNLILVSIKL